MGCFYCPTKVLMLKKQVKGVMTGNGQGVITGNTKLFLRLNDDLLLNQKCSIPLSWNEVRGRVLFELYEKYTADLFVTEKKGARRNKRLSNVKRLTTAL